MFQKIAKHRANDASNDVHRPPLEGVGLQGLKGSRGRPTGSQGVKGQAYRVSGGQGVGLKGPRGSRGRGKMFHRIGSDIWWVLWWFVMQTRWSWVCMRPRDLFRGPRGFMGGPGGASGSRRASRGSHGAIREVRRVFWWFMRHVCLYILWSRFLARVDIQPEVVREVLADLKMSDNQHH